MKRGRTAIRNGKIALLVALVMSVLSGWGASASGPHCANHTVRPHLAAPYAASHAHSAPTALRDATGHECTHCPPSDCSRIAPCTASANAALSASMVAVADLSPHRVTLPVRDEPQPFPAYQPPTPPPQSLS